MGDKKTTFRHILRDTLERTQGTTVQPACLGIHPSSSEPFNENKQTKQMTKIEEGYQWIKTSKLPTTWGFT